MQYVHSDEILPPNQTYDSEPTSEDTVDHELFGRVKKNTLQVIQTTENVIVDFAKLGYELFKEKLYQALVMLDNFMQMKPMWLRITRTYVIGNDTDSRNSDALYEVEDKATQTDDVETNTESPLTKKGSTIATHRQQIEDQDETQELTQTRGKPVTTDTEKTQGFFERLKNSIGNLFSGIFIWF